MKKLNNKGFAIASILYSIMVLFLLLLLSILGILGNRKAILDKNKKDILEELNKEVLYNKINFEHRNITIINRGNLDDIRFALLDGVSAIDENGNEIGLDKINYNLDLNNIENKSYNVTYTVDRGNKIITATRQISFVPDSSDYIDTFDYTGDSQTLTTKYNGSYRVELWGAQGGSNEISTGGAGAYTSGYINLKLSSNLVIFVGGSGLINDDVTLTPGYNGGGVGSRHMDYSADNFSLYGAGGGGSTDVRLVNGNWDDFASLKTRLMVASGGSGASNWHNPQNGVAGGSLIGINGHEFSQDENAIYTNASGGTQISGGSGALPLGSENGGFGYGGSINNDKIMHGSGGGSGYYGGGSGGINDGVVMTGASGSSFISGYDGCDAISEESTEDNIIHTGQSIHYSGYKFENAVMYAGNEEMPTHDGTSTMIGNSGNGFAKISLIYYYNDDMIYKYISDGLVVHYDSINNIGGGHSSDTTVWRDLSGNNNDGNLTGFAFDETSGWTSNSLKINGKMYVRATNYDLTNFTTEDFTVTVTFKSPEIINGPVLVSTGNWKKSGFYLQFRTNNKISINVNQIDASQGTFTTNNSLQNNMLHNITFVRTGAIIKSYVDGIYNTQITNAVNLDAAQYAYTINTNKNWVGEIMNTKVYNRALTESEVKINYDIDKVRYKS